MDWLPINWKLLGNPVNYFVILFAALFWFMLFDVVGRHYASKDLT